MYCPLSHGSLWHRYVLWCGTFALAVLCIGDTEFVVQTFVAASATATGAWSSAPQLLKSLRLVR